VNYLRGLDKLRDAATNTVWYSEFLVQEAALRENLRDEARYGSTDQLRHSRSRIIDQLNTMAIRQINLSFNDLCLDRLSLEEGTRIQIESVTGEHKSDNEGQMAGNSIKVPEQSSRVRRDGLSSFR
jgi:hypothetical protein